MLDLVYRGLKTPDPKTIPAEAFTVSGLMRGADKCRGTPSPNKMGSLMSQGGEEGDPSNNT